MAAIKDGASPCAGPQRRDSGAMTPRARPPRRGTLAALTALAACAGSPAGPGPALEFFADAPGDATARIELAGDRVESLAVALGPGLLPPAVRTAVEAVAPGGVVAFAGFESGMHGVGYRVEKRYPETGQTRSLLANRDGTVLERWHSVPVREVPTDALRTIAELGATVDEARIVSGREREERWTFVVRDRLQRRSVVHVSLRGERLAVRRQLDATVDG